MMTYLKKIYEVPTTVCNAVLHGCRLMEGTQDIFNSVPDTSGGLSPIS